MKDEASSWAPDGKRIAFVRTTVDEFGIWTMSGDGTDRRQLTSPVYGEAEDKSPFWYDPNALAVSPTGKRPFTWGWLKSLR